MLKEPLPGRVKTRLGHEMGMVQAAGWFRRTALSLIRRLRDPRWTIVLAVSPDRSGQISRVWPADLERTPQGRGDLGVRMARMIRAMPPGPVCVIGADVPEMSRQHIARAFKALGSSDAVFGPATDGGYWLVGMKRTRTVPPGLFKNVRWSTEFALDDTMASIPDRSIGLVATLTDVDTLSDLNRLTGKLA